MGADGHLDAAFILRRGASRVGADRVALLKAVAELGSISAAARQVGLSYKGAWDGVQALNNLFDAPLIEAQAGGKAGGTAVVTPRGLAVIEAFRKLEAELGETLSRLEARLERGGLGDVFWSLGMKTSARNALRGVVSRIEVGAVNSEVTLQVAPGVEIVSVVTRQSVDELALAVGKPALALIKSSFVVLAKGEGLVTSARNQLPGRVLSREDGAVSSEVTLSLADGKTLTATITRESGEAMGLRQGELALALIKASHVILAVE